MKDLPRLELTGDPNNKNNEYIIFPNSFREKEKRKGKPGNKNISKRNKNTSKGHKKTSKRNKKTNKWLFF